jgi:hypothetical protein
MIPNSAGVHTIQDGNGNAYKISTDDYVKGSEERVGSRYLLSPVVGVGNAGKRVKRNTSFFKEALDVAGTSKVVPVYDLNVDLEYQIKGIEEVGEGRKDIIADGVAVIIPHIEGTEFSSGSSVDLSQIPQKDADFLYVLGIQDFGGLVSCLAQATGGKRMYIDTSGFLDQLVNSGMAINLSHENGMLRGLYLYFRRAKIKDYAVYGD